MFPRLRDEFDAFILGRLSQYPPALQCLIPLFLLDGKHDITSFDCLEIFRLFLDAMRLSRAELGPGHQLDATLLHIHSEPMTPSFQFDPAFCTLFEDRSRAGRFFVDGATIAILAKHLLRTLSIETYVTSRSVIKWSRC